MNVPRLRFKEFSGEWEVKKFGDVFSFMFTNSLSRESLTYDDGVVKNIHYGDIHTKFKSNFKIENENVPFINNEINISKISEDCYCREGDLIVADASEDYADIGKSIEIISLNSQKLLAGLHTYIARDLSKQMALGFSGYLMQTVNVRLQIKTLATGISVLGISKGNLAKVNLSVPSKPEQTKIANFLTAVDEKIAQITQKGELLARYKKGVMQLIFSQQLRFKPALSEVEGYDDGREFPEWEEKSLENFLIPELREVKKPKEPYLAIGIRSHCKGTFQKPEANPEKNAMDNLFQVKENDLIVNITFAWEGAIAIVKKEDNNGFVSHRFPTYLFKEEVTNSKFFQYVFIRPRFREQLDLISPGGAGRNRVMSKKDFLKIKCELPTVPEQTKIANFLTALDDKITNNQTQLNALKQYKQGLLQQMFV